jgi:hypothetical protein
MLFAMTAVSSLTGKSPAKGMLATILGLMIATIGIDLQSGQPRYTMGIPEFQDGVGFIVVVVGLFAMAEVFRGLEGVHKGTAPEMIKISGKLWLTKEEWQRSIGPIWRGGIIGFVIGVLPGAGGTIASIMSYTTEKRLSKLKPRLKRSGLSNLHPLVIAHENDTKVKRLAGKIDRVLVDAPCSGMGTLRRNPDLKFRQSPEGVAELVAKQTAILNAAARLVKPGGRLVYATCSLLTEENQQIVTAFLAAHTQFTALNCGELLQKQGITLECGTEMQLWPHIDRTDGFFAVALERASG